MSAAVKEPFLERNWMLIVIALGLVLTLFLALYDPMVPGEPNKAERQGMLRTDGSRDAVRAGGE